MFDKSAWLCVILLFLFLIVLIGFSYFYQETRQERCHNLYGVYIQSQCFKAELIKL